MALATRSFLMQEEEKDLNKKVDEISEGELDEIEEQLTGQTTIR